MLFLQISQNIMITNQTSIAFSYGSGIDDHLYRSVPMSMSFIIKIDVTNFVNNSSPCLISYRVHEEIVFGIVYANVKTLRSHHRRKRFTMRIFSFLSIKKRKTFESNKFIGRKHKAVKYTDKVF